MIVPRLRIGWGLLALCMLAAPVFGQFHEADPGAREAFAEMVDAYRARPALTVHTHIAVEVREGDIVGQSSGIEAKFTLGQNRTGVVNLRGFTLYLADGSITAVHEDNDQMYFTTSDDGSPYYALMTAFMDMPFPHLAIAFGEDDIDDLCMQFHPRAPWCRPTAVRTEKRGDDPGEEVRIITMTSDFEEIEIAIDPETQLMQTVTVRIFDGHLVQPGTEMFLRHRFDYEVHEEMPDDLLTFDPGNRQRVDSLAAMLPRREMAAMPTGRRGVVGGGMIGQPAPPFDLERLNGERVTLDAMRGRVVVLDFWATWCRPCIQAMPMLHEVAAWAAEQNLPVTVLTVNSWEIPNLDDNDPDKRRQQAKDLWEKQGFTLPVLMDVHDETAAAFGVQGLPTTVIIRPDGIIHTQHIGVQGNYVEQLKADILEAIGNTEM